MLLNSTPNRAVRRNLCVSKEAVDLISRLGETSKRHSRFAHNFSNQSCERRYIIVRADRFLQTLGFCEGARNWPSFLCVVQSGAAILKKLSLHFAHADSIINRREESMRNEEADVSGWQL